MQQDEKIDVLLVFNTNGNGQERIFYSSELERFLNSRREKIGHIFIDKKTIIPTPAIQRIGAQVYTSSTESITDLAGFLLHFVSVARQKKWSSMGIAIPSSLPMSGMIERQLSAFKIAFTFHPKTGE